MPAAWPSETAIEPVLWALTSPDILLLRWSFRPDRDDPGRPLGIWGVVMQVQGGSLRDDDAGDIATTFSAWAEAHRASGGDFEERALHAGIRATVAAYRSGLSLNDAFHVGRQAYYSALG